MMRTVPSEGCHQLESASGDHSDLPRTEEAGNVGSFVLKLEQVVILRARTPAKVDSSSPTDIIWEFRPDIATSSVLQEKPGIWLSMTSFTICK